MDPSQTYPLQESQFYSWKYLLRFKEEVRNWGYWLCKPQRLHEEYSTVIVRFRTVSQELFSSYHPYSRIKQNQWSIDGTHEHLWPKNINKGGDIEEGKIITLSHSKEFGSVTCVINRRETEKLQYFIYGHCILKAIHIIMACREHQPSKKIFLQKIDQTFADCRDNLNWNIEIQTIMKYLSNRISLIALCLTFEENISKKWSMIHEMATDMESNIIGQKSWEPKKKLWFVLTYILRNLSCKIYLLNMQFLLFSESHMKTQMYMYILTTQQQCVST